MSRQLDIHWTIVNHHLLQTEPGMDERSMTVTAEADDRVTHPVQRRDGVTLWRQIAGQIQSEITSGACKQGTRLPTEAELSVRFGVNRHTVRRALEELSRDGLVRVEQGRGSFVAEDVLDYNVEARTRFSEWIRRSNKEPSGIVRQLREIPADRRVAEGLGVRSRSRVVVLERLGFAGDAPEGHVAGVAGDATDHRRVARRRGRRLPAVTDACDG
jgi:GntR family phosphonate transport system transcriptional regulator